MAGEGTGGFAGLGGWGSALAQLIRGDESPSQYNAAIGQARYVQQAVERTGLLPGLPRPLTGSEPTGIPQQIAAALARVVSSGVVPSGWTSVAEPTFPSEPAAAAANPWTPTPSGTPSGIPTVARSDFAAVPGSTPFAQPRPGYPAPGQPPQYDPDTTRRLFAQLAWQALQEWLQRRAQSQRARAAAKAWRAQWAAIQRAIAARQVQLSGGIARLTGGIMPDLMQFSGTGGLSSLYGGGGYESAGLGWGDALFGLGSLAINAFANRQNQGALAPYGDPWGPDWLYSQSDRASAALSQSFAGGCGSPFVAGGAALRPSTFSMSNPATGKLTWFRPAGRPILWSSDLGACRRVARIARKAKRRAGGR